MMRANCSRMPGSDTSFAPMSVEVTEDAALGGRLRLKQPKRGHRVGHDAILLAAASPARAGERAVDLGAGVGAAGLALALRVEGTEVVLVEVDAGLARLAAENAQLNGLNARVRSTVLDVAAPARAFAAAGLGPESVAHVLMNPPFNDLAGGLSWRRVAGACSDLEDGNRAAGASGRGGSGNPGSGAGDEGKPRAARAAAGLRAQRPFGMPDCAGGIGAARRRGVAVERELKCAGAVWRCRCRCKLIEVNLSAARRQPKT